MSQTKERKIVSRRDRPAKAPLSQEAIVVAALSVLKDEGLGGLSLRKVASRLDTGAASLYVYVSNLEELHALMLDRVLGKVASMKLKKGHWSEQLCTLLLAFQAALSEISGIGRLSMVTVVHGPNFLRLVERVLQLLGEAGLDGRRAAWGVDLLMLHCTATAAEQDLRREKNDLFSALKHNTAQVDPMEFPATHALKEELFAGSEKDRQVWAIRTLIDGLVADSSS